MFNFRVGVLHHHWVREGTMVMSSCGRRTAALYAFVWLIAGMAAAARPAAAADDAPFTWTGLYVGAHKGGAIDYNKFSNPYGPTLFGDEVRSPGPIGGLQFGGNYQMG
jgi:hypothetical protein